MSTKVKVGIAIAALLAAFAFGRFTTPVQVKTEIKTVEVEKKVETKDTDRDKHQETVVVEVKKPDGTVETTTKVVMDSHTDQKTKDVTSDSKSTDQTKEVTRSSSPVTLSVLGGASLNGLPTLVYGGALTKPVLGPITIGIFGLSNMVVGASIGLQF